MQAGARLGSQWTSRRKPCVQGPLRRAHPASGATWNVQVVRGKVTSRCLWHACRALSLGLLLMLLGAAMATIGYYADQLSVGQEIRGNATVRVKNESRGFHLNNLSYAGPIVMGVGGFIVVAACVMTFEARDSAAKVVPARFKVAPGKVRQVAAAARRSAGSQTGRWEQHLGVFKSSPTSSDRRALTAAFMQFSKHLGSGEQRPSPSNSPRPLLASSLSPKGPPRAGLLRSGSVPELGRGPRPARSPQLPQSKREPPRRPRPTLLNPAMLQRQALSVDESHVRSHVRYSRESLAGSQGSMAMDLHVPSEGPVTLRIRDRSRTTLRNTRATSRPPNTRSDTARRHMLARQRPIDDDEHHGGHNGDKPREPHACGPHCPGRQTVLVRDSTGNSIHRRSSNSSDTIHSQGRQRRERRYYGPPRRSASTSPQPRRTMARPPPISLDLGPSHPICEDQLSPDLHSEYHTVCEEHIVSIPSDTRPSPLVFTNSAESRDSKYSTETGTLHTAEINISDEAMMEYDLQVETPSSSHTENDAVGDLTDDMTPTIQDIITGTQSDATSTVIDVVCCDPEEQSTVNDE